MASQETTNEEDGMKDIADPRETDVLCGRGGAALRHAGNQTYRRLVNLNKGLYITCMKTEKLKISRSIVAAIREQKGRFLERDAKKGVWFDIGDKKAVEKTSQALREGQPKLRKEMVARGQIPADEPTAGIGNGIYNTRGAHPNSNINMDGSMHGNMNMLMNSGMNMNSIGRLSSIGSGNSGNSGNSYSSMLDAMQLQQQKNQMMMGRNNTGQLRNNMEHMPPPPLRTLSNGTSMNSMNSMGCGGNDLTILQRLSLDSTPQSVPSWTPSMGSMESLMTMSTGDVPQMLSRRNLLRPYNRNPSYGSYNNNNSINSINNSNMHTLQSITSNSTCSNSSNNNDISDFMNGNGRGIDRNNMIEPTIFSEKIGSFDPTEQPFRQQQQQQQFTRAPLPTLNAFNESSNSCNNNNNNNNNNSNKSNNIDNLNVERPTGPTGRSVNDRRAYFAKMKYGRGKSSNRSITDGMPDIHMVDSQFSLLSNLSAHGSKHRGHNAADMDISKHGVGKKDSMGSEYIGVGSRRSLMSGLSKLSGHSTDINNTFTNMAKKFTSTNHTISSRSLTMSEFSGVEEEFAEDDFNFDIPTQRNP